MFDGLPTEFYVTKLHEERLTVTLPRAERRANIERELTAAQSVARGRYPRPQRVSAVAGWVVALRRLLPRSAGQAGAA